MSLLEYTYIYEREEKVFETEKEHRCNFMDIENNDV